MLYSIVLQLLSVWCCGSFLGQHCFYPFHLLIFLMGEEMDWGIVYSGTHSIEFSRFFLLFQNIRVSTSCSCFNRHRYFLLHSIDIDISYFIHVFHTERKLSLLSYLCLLQHLLALQRYLYFCAGVNAQPGSRSFFWPFLCCRTLWTYQNISEDHILHWIHFASGVFLYLPQLVLDWHQ